MRSSPRRAFTLIEALIACGLLGMVLVATYAALILSLRYQQKHEDQVDAFLEAFNAMNRIQTALAAGAAESLVYAPDDTGFVFISAQPAAGGPFEHDDEGRPKWQKAVAFYVEEAGENRFLRLKERPLAPSSTLPATPSVDEMRDDPALARVTLARNLAILRVVPGGDLTLKIKTLREKDFNSITLRSRLTFRL